MMSWMPVLGNGNLVGQLWRNVVCLTSFDVYALQHLIACLLHAFCMLSACHTNVCCLAITCDSVMALHLTFNFWCLYPFTFLLHCDHHSFVLLHICPIVHSFIFPLSVWVIVSYIPLIADEAVCTGAVGSGGSTRVNLSSPIHCLSKTRRPTPHHSSSSCTGREHRNRPSAAVPCIPCVRCAKRFAGAP